MEPVRGLHHVSAISADAQKAVDFYVGVLGLRLVKTTVNFDDPQTHHIYFADEAGLPGTLLTFFPWQGIRRGRQGPGQVAVTTFAVPPESVGFWTQRLVALGVDFDTPFVRQLGQDAETVIGVRDPEGQLLEIVAHPGAAARTGWQRMPGIAPEHAIRGFHSVTLWISAPEATQRVLTAGLGMEVVGQAADVTRFGYPPFEPGTLVDVRRVPSYPAGTGGAGTVHHVAFSVTDEAAQMTVREQVLALGHTPTPVIDRTYFRSVYFREPGGVLFELATLPPGMTVDEPLARLGQTLQLPPHARPLREAIEAHLPRLTLPVPPGFVHYFAPPDPGGHGEAVTLLLLHGTGGDENDLVPLGRSLVPGAALLSPRGRVLEGANPRFFRRFGDGSFDLADLGVRTDELGQFVANAQQMYYLPPEGLVAVGYSNGANIAASLLLSQPGLLPRLVLFSPQVPFEPEALPDLSDTRVFIAAGRRDPVVPATQTLRLDQILRSAGAAVELHWESGGHELGPGAVRAASEWLAGEGG